MLNALSTINDVLRHYGRLRTGKLALVGALTCSLGTVLLLSAAIFGWVWKAIHGHAYLPGHEILGGELDYSFLLPLPLTWIGYQILKGRFGMSLETAERQQESWDDAHWAIWNQEHAYSISSANFVLSFIGVVTLLCLFGAVIAIFIPATD